MNFTRLLEHVESLVERRFVRFSKPLLSQDTRRDPPSRFSKGGLRHVGEWISTCALVDRVVRLNRVDHGLFYSSATGRHFVRALESRMCSLTAPQMFQVLLAGNRFKAPIEGIVLRELRHQLGELDTVELLRLPSLVKAEDSEFSRCLSKEIELRVRNNGNSPGAKGKLESVLVNVHRSHFNKCG